VKLDTYQPHEEHGNNIMSLREATFAHIQQGVIQEHITSQLIFQCKLTQEHQAEVRSEQLHFLHGHQANVAVSPYLLLNLASRFNDASGVSCILSAM
jgi:hypothetical protein